MSHIKRAEHRGLTFPDGLTWVEVRGDPIVALDAFMAGCVSSYLGGDQTGDRRIILDEGARALRDLLPELRGEARAYASRLVRMADLILSDPFPKACPGRTGVERGQGGLVRGSLLLPLAAER